MKAKSILSITILALWLVACAAPTATPPVLVTQVPFPPAPTLAASTPYPPPVVDTPEPTLPAYPAPTPNPAAPPSGYEPQPGDGKLMRDQVFVDVENSEVVVSMSQPVQASVLLNGNLSDPCHQLRVVVSPPNAQKEIMLDVYSVVDPSLVCIMVIKPFNVTIPLGTFSGGHFSVFANGQLIGEFDA